MLKRAQFQFYGLRGENLPRLCAKTRRLALPSAPTVVSVQGFRCDCNWSKLPYPAHQYFGIELRSRNLTLISRYEAPFTICYFEEDSMGMGDVPAGLCFTHSTFSCRLLHPQYMSVIVIFLAMVH